MGKPTGIKKLLSLTDNSAKYQNINSVKETLITLNKSYTYLNDTNLNKIIRILNVYNNKPNLRPFSTKIAEFKGKIQAQIEKNNPQTKRKRSNNNNGTANRSTKKVTTGTSRVNRIRPFIMKMSHL